VFDLDGTLIDSLADLANSSNEVLAGMGYPVHDHDAYHSSAAWTRFARFTPAAVVNTPGLTPA